MKKIVSMMMTLVIAICAASAVKAESISPESGPQIAKEASLMVQHLHLKGDTAVKFLKIYADYRTELEKVHSECRPFKPQVVDGKKVPLTEAQIDENIRNDFKVSHKIIDIREKYYKQFKTILTPSQIGKMFRHEKKIADRKRHEMNKRRKAAEKRHNVRKKTAKPIRKNLGDTLTVGKGKNLERKS